MSQYEFTNAVADILDEYGILLDFAILSIISDCWASVMSISDCVDYIAESN